MCSVVWCGVVWCGVWCVVCGVWCVVCGVRCGVRCGVWCAVWCGAVYCTVVKCSVVQCSVVCVVWRGVCSMAWCVWCGVQVFSTKPFVNCNVKHSILGSHATPKHFAEVYCMNYRYYLPRKSFF